MKSSAKLSRWLAQAFDAPPVIDSPTVSVSTVSVIASPVDYSPKRIGASGSDLDLAGDTHFRYKGFREASGVAANPTVYVETKIKPGGSTQFAYWQFFCDFDTSAPQVEIRLRAATVAPNFCIRVNGRWISQADFTATGIVAGNNFRILLDFAGVVRQRRIEVGFSQRTGFGGVTVTTGVSVLRPLDATMRRVAFIGDSFTNGAGLAPVGANPCETFARRLGYLMGADEVILAGIGGTGWITMLSGDVTSVFAGRIPEVLLLKPDAIVFLGSRNDTANIAQLGQAVVAALDLCAETKEVYVAGIPYTTDPLSGVSFATRNAIIGSATKARGRTYLDVANCFYGTGNVSAPNGTGNCDFLIQSDAVHPNHDGHKRLAESLFMAISGVPNETPSALSP